MLREKHDASCFCQLWEGCVAHWEEECMYKRRGSSVNEQAIQPNGWINGWSSSEWNSKYSTTIMFILEIDNSFFILSIEKIVNHKGVYFKYKNK